MVGEHIGDQLGNLLVPGLDIALEGLWAAAVTEPTKTQRLAMSMQTRWRNRTYTMTPSVVSATGMISLPSGPIALLTLKAETALTMAM